MQWQGGTDGNQDLVLVYPLGQVLDLTYENTVPVLPRSRAYPVACQPGAIKTALQDLVLGKQARKFQPPICTPPPS